MPDTDTTLRFHAINREAADFGYRLEVDFVPNGRTPMYRGYTSVA